MSLLPPNAAAPTERSETASFERLVLDALPAGVIALDRKHRACYANPAAMRSLGLESGDLPLAERLAPWLDNDELVTHLEAAEQLGGERRLAYPTLGPEGAPSEIGLSVVPARGEAAERLSVIVLLRSLDEQRAAAEHGHRAERLRSIGRFAAGLAHEVRNPLAAIQGLAEGLIEELGPEDSRAEYAVRIQRQVVRVESLIRRCLDLGGEAMARCASRPSDIVEEALALLDEGHGVEVVGATSLPRVLGDPRQLVECLHALVLNALEAHGDPTEPVRVHLGTAEDEPQHLVVRVIDHGPGIAAHLVDRIFEPFFTTRPGAAGLGLTAARLIAESHDGSLTVESRPGETTFMLTLAVADPREGRS